MKTSEQMKIYVNEIILLSPTDEEMYLFVRHLEKHNLVMALYHGVIKNIMAPNGPVFMILVA